MKTHQPNESGVDELDCQECASVSGAMLDEAIALAHDRGRNFGSNAEVNEADACPGCPYIGQMQRQHDLELPGVLGYGAGI